jgi:hypothetical protein
MRPLRMVPMTSLPPFQARLLAARLGAEGILWQLRGESAVYPIAAVEVLVEADEVERARALLDPDWARGSGADPEELRSGPGEAAGGDPDPDPDGVGRRRSARALMVWLVMAVVLVALALRISHLG